MTTVDVITILFAKVDDTLRDVQKHPLTGLYPSEIVTLGMLFALKGVGNRAFYRWLVRDYLPLFPRLPERTRLFRLLKKHQGWTNHFLAEPSLVGIADTYGIELLHPRREGRSPHQLGDKGLSNWRWIIGTKLGFVLNHLGLFVAWDCHWASIADKDFRPLVAQFVEQMVVLVDSGFHSKTDDPTNMKVCPRGQWNTRRLVETVLSMLTTVCHLKKVAHRQADYFRARMGFILSSFNVLVQWHGLNPDARGMVHLSIAEFSLLAPLVNVLNTDDRNAANCSGLRIDTATSAGRLTLVLIWQYHRKESLCFSAMSDKVCW